MTATRLRIGPHFAPATALSFAPPLRLWFFRYAPDTRVPMHTHDRAHVVIHLKGLVHENGHDGHTTFDAPVMIYYPAGAMHEDVIGPAGAEAVIIEFDDDILLRTAPEYIHRLGSISRTAERPVIQATLNALSPTGANVHHGNKAEALAAEIARALYCPQKLDTTAPQWLVRIRLHLEGAKLQVLTSAQIEQLARRNKFHVMRTFLQRYSVPMGEYARAMQVKRSLQLLRRGAAPLLDVALQLGFSDQSHFSRTFKRFTNMTPGQYRRHKI